MKITIADTDKFYELLSNNRLKLATSIQKLIERLLSNAMDDKELRVVIHISLDLLAPSYKRVPSGFAHSLNQCGWRSVQSFLKGGCMVVRAAKRPMPTTFKALAMAKLLRYQRFKALKETIPASYWVRPNLFSSMIRKELEIEDKPFSKVSFVQKKKFIVWRIS